MPPLARLARAASAAAADYSAATAGAGGTNAPAAKVAAKAVPDPVANQNAYDSARRLYENLYGGSLLAAFTAGTVAAFVGGYLFGRIQGPADMEPNLHRSLESAENRFQKQLDKHYAQTQDALRDHAAETDEMLQDLETAIECGDLLPAAILP